jgi:hypothetical protein
MYNLDWYFYYAPEFSFSCYECTEWITDPHFPHEYLGKEGTASIKRPGQVEVTGWRPLC